MTRLRVTRQPPATQQANLELRNSHAYSLKMLCVVSQFKDLERKCRFDSYNVTPYSHFLMTLRLFVNVGVLAAILCEEISRNFL